MHCRHQRSNGEIRGADVTALYTTVSFLNFSQTHGVEKVHQGRDDLDLHVGHHEDDLVLLGLVGVEEEVAQVGGGRAQDEPVRRELAVGADDPDVGELVRLLADLGHGADVGVVAGEDDGRGLGGHLRDLLGALGRRGVGRESHGDLEGRV